MVDKVAGHEFDEFGRCLLKQTNTDLPCPIRWRDIAHVDASYVGQKSYAHYMLLNLSECQEIMRKAEHERILCEIATAEACGRVVIKEEK